MKTDTTSTWAINGFPKDLRLKYAAYVKGSGITILDHLRGLVSEHLISKGVDIASCDLLSLLRRVEAKKQKRKITRVPANQTTTA